MSIYTVIKQAPAYHQMTIEEFLFGDNSQSNMMRSNATNTRTYMSEYVNPKLLESVDIRRLIRLLKEFNWSSAVTKGKDRMSLYNTFYQPKKDKGMQLVFREVFKSQKRYVKCDSREVCHQIATGLLPFLKQHPTDKDEEIFIKAYTDVMSNLSKNGFDIDKVDLPAAINAGFRRIDAPNYELKMALSTLKDLLERNFGVLYHTSAFAYIKGRSTLKAMKRHQSNESKWFLKLDFSNFFGNTTLEFVMKMLSMIFPFCEIVKYEDGREALEKALELGFLNGSLPQGTPLSPLLTNIMMVPIDYHVTKALRNFRITSNGEDVTQSFVYTRYSDDSLISSKYNFNPKMIENFYVSVLKRFDAPFTINTQKTRYGSSSGRNWNLGTMLNRDNNITVGFRNKRRMKAALHSYALDKKNGKDWELTAVQRLAGKMSYYRMVERETIDYMITHICKNVHMDIRAMMKLDLST